MTNGDYIRSLNNFELSELLEYCCYCSLKSDDNCDGKCRQHIIEWLEHERKNDQMDKQLVYVECIACGKPIPVNDPRTDTSIILCDDCKHAIAYASELLNKVFKKDGEQDD